MPLKPVKKIRKLVLTISDEAGYYRIIVRNTIDKSVLKGNSKLKTDKHDKKRHGWGLKSVEDIVAKHSGLIDFYENENEFFVDIMSTIKD